MNSKKYRSTLLLSAAIVGAVAFTSAVPAFGAPKKPKKEKDHKVTICYHNHTMSIAVQALDSLLKNGATLGPCETSPQ